MDTVRKVLDGGVSWVQYRQKNKERRAMYVEAEEMRKLTASYGACLVVNDFADIALAVDADGVHLGQDDLPLREARKIMGTGIVGISTHRLSEAIEAEAGGADYVGFGPLFPTTTKDAGEPKGVHALESVCTQLRIPVIAIGGIKVSHVEAVFRAGCAGIAVSSGLLFGDIRETAREFMSCIGRTASIS
jgi:thiamine-phosphate pyrophosphorylase